MRSLALTRKLTTLLCAFVLIVLLIAAAQAQTYNVLHNFTNGLDGAFPVGSLSTDRAGSIYGVTAVSDDSSSDQSAIAPNGVPGKSLARMRSAISPRPAILDSVVLFALNGFFVNVAAW